MNVSSALVSFAALSPLFAALAALLGALLPALIAVIQQPKWPGGLRVGVTIALCLLCGAVYAAAQHKLDGVSIAAAVVIVLQFAWTTYLGAWKPSGLSAQIEAATSQVLGDLVSRFTAKPAPAVSGSPAALAAALGLTLEEINAALAAYKAAGAAAPAPAPVAAAPAAPAAPAASPAPAAAAATMAAAPVPVPAAG